MACSSAQAKPAHSRARGASDTLMTPAPRVAPIKIVRKNDDFLLILAIRVFLNSWHLVRLCAPTFSHAPAFLPRVPRGNPARPCCRPRQRGLNQCAILFRVPVMARCMSGPTGASRPVHAPGRSGSGGWFAFCVRSLLLERLRVEGCCAASPSAGRWRLSSSMRRPGRSSARPGACARVTARSRWRRSIAAR
jgi:hypothetical protein